MVRWEATYHYKKDSGHNCFKGMDVHHTPIYGSKDSFKLIVKAKNGQHEWRHHGSLEAAQELLNILRYREI